VTTRKKWISHLEENNINYFQHMFFAIGIAKTAILAGLCLFIHALLPCYFQKSSSNMLVALAEKFKTR
jgi:hypothetical protein